MMDDNHILIASPVTILSVIRQANHLNASLQRYILVQSAMRFVIDFPYDLPIQNLYTNFTLRNICCKKFLIIMFHEINMFIYQLNSKLGAKILSWLHW